MATTARSADGVPIAYEIHGQGEPALVLVHGWAFDRHLWDLEAPRLAARRRVITLDLGGHGQSGRQRGRWTMAALGEDVKAVVEAAGARRVILIGHSMGGPVVLEAARRMPERVAGIVVVDVLLDVEQRTPPDQIEDYVGKLTADYKTTATSMANGYLFAPATPAPVRERVLAHAMAIAPDLSIELLRQVWSYDPLPALAKIQAPIRAVNADTFPTNVETNRRHMPGYEATIVPDTGHYPMLERPDAFAAALDRALAQVLAAAKR